MRLIAAEPQIRSVDAALIGAACIAAGSAATSYLTGIGCPALDLAGVHCAFCGATRSVIALTEAEFSRAVAANSLIVFALALVALRTLLQLLGASRLVRRADRWVERIDIRAWAGLILIWALVRNLPWFSFFLPVT